MDLIKLGAGGARSLLVPGGGHMWLEQPQLRGPVAAGARTEAQTFGAAPPASCPCLSKGARRDMQRGAWDLGTPTRVPLPLTWREACSGQMACE